MNDEQLIVSTDEQNKPSWIKKNTPIFCGYGEVRWLDVISASSLGRLWVAMKSLSDRTITIIAGHIINSMIADINKWIIELNETDFPGRLTQ